jgi:hypothetical protein
MLIVIAIIFINFFITKLYQGSRVLPGVIKNIPAKQGYFSWLAWRDGFRTMKWREAVGDLDTTLKQIRHLLSLV